MPARTYLALLNAEFRIKSDFQSLVSDHVLYASFLEYVVA